MSCGGESIDQKPQGSRKDKLMTEGCLGQPSPKTEDDALLTRRSCLQRKLHDDSRGTALASASGCRGLNVPVAPTQEAAPLLQTAQESATSPGGSQPDRAGTRGRPLRGVRREELDPMTAGHHGAQTVCTRPCLSQARTDAGDARAGGEAAAGTETEPARKPGQPVRRSPRRPSEAGWSCPRSNAHKGDGPGRRTRSVEPTAPGPEAAQMLPEHMRTLQPPSRRP